MAKVRITTPEQKPWQISPVRAEHAEARALLPDGGPASAYKIREPGSETTPQLVELRMHPHEEVALHSHDEDEIIYVLSGEMKVGTRTIGAGASLYIAGGVFYGFTAGPEGVHFLNFRARDDRSFHLPGKRQIIDTGVTS
ncbi:cupin domain-containing protein [Novosphingobium sp. PS1R-30]|uniref:Cupin domain-containing protein n=1 Tax=Novosphingobium anseongense TaxID=3133436 RepID=A0ABU8RQ83_9SPHN